MPRVEVGSRWIAPNGEGWTVSKLSSWLVTLERAGRTMEVDPRSLGGPGWTPAPKDDDDFAVSMWDGGE